MIESVSKDEIVDAIQIHWKLQLGSYFKCICDLGGVKYNLGERVTDYYWNYAGLIECPPDAETKLVEDVISFAITNTRVPAIYIDPSSHSTTLIDAMRQKGFEAEDEEIWMFWDQSADIDEKSPNGLNITTVDSLDKMKIFVDVFNESYEMLEEGETNSVYGLSLMDAYHIKPRGVEIVHLIGYVNSDPVSIASVYIADDVAGIYNVGTPPKYRNQGYGRALSLAAINRGKSQKPRRMLLETELNSGPQRLYSKLGFRPAFSAAIWAMNSE